MSSSFIRYLFFLSFLKKLPPLFENADGKNKYFIQEKYDLVISTLNIVNK
jgi:hypothetical protein